MLAAILGFVAALTWELATVTGIAWRAHRAVGVDFVRFMHSPILISAFVLAFVPSFAYCFWLFRRGRRLPIPILAAVFGFVLVWTIAALFISLISRETQPSPIPLLSIVLFFSSMTAMFGFYGGVLGGGWLRLRLSHIRSTARLMAESAIPGVVLGALFPVLFFIIPGGYTARSTTPSTPLENVIPVVIFAVAGCLISMAFGYAFRRRLITTSVI